MQTIVGRRFDSGDVVRVGIDHELVVSIESPDIPASELTAIPWIAPGLFDIQVNGFHGLWFSSETLTVDEVEQIIRAYRSQGISRCLPTLITNSQEAIEHGLSTIRHACETIAEVRQTVVGCHVEGPFISPVDGPRGAHPLRHVRPAGISEFRSWQRASGGRVRLVTLAPEVEGAMPFISELSAEGVVIALGHTAASSSVITEAIDRGARLGTHLGNGCAGMIPRHDNVFWPQLSDDRFTCSVIADGWHVPPSMLRCIMRCKPRERILLTSDVSGFGGCAPGTYSTGDVAVDVLTDGRIVVAGQTQFLAGSGATTGDCVAHLMDICGLTLEEAWPMASTQPAELLGCRHTWLQTGQSPDFTLFRMDSQKVPEGGQRTRFIPVSVCSQSR